MRCEQEMCANWDGFGCPCAVLDLEPVVMCDCGSHLSRDRCCFRLIGGDS